MRLKLPNIDRVGLILDLSRCLAEEHINIISMEVELKTIYLEVDITNPDEKKKIMARLQEIEGILTVSEIDLMPHQLKAEEIRAVLTAIGDGILSIDQQGRVTQYNPAAERILRVPAHKVIGHPLSNFLPEDMAIFAALRSGHVYNNQEVILEKTNSHYLTSGRPIFDQSGRIIGAVAILKDISDVRALVQTVTAQLPLTFEEITYSSTEMQQVITLAKTYARSDSTVLIRGETGTGKELFARALHAASPRSHKIFIPVNCAAIPDTLLESELFGYEEGAFTGASKGGKQGLFELAQDGTLFLDEIGEISTHLQAKLLRVLQDKKVRRLGSPRENSVNVRILAATNRNLEEMIQKNQFREDLYYRLNVIPLFIPPLRARPEDIPQLAQVFLDRFSTRLQKQVDTISETALQKLLAYNWPGNIRELENVIERAINIVTGNIILSDHIILHHTLPPVYAAANQAKKKNKLLKAQLDETEKEVLQLALKEHHTSRQLGLALGLSHTAVLKKLRKHNLIPLKE
ncbi:MAG: sigma 54-interacting transcriptional regulator [Sporomusaceae bacterium]|nr:sigma 54-interacting transcriptional regulator [Sporomusaceae bacterium]